MTRVIRTILISKVKHIVKLCNTIFNYFTIRGGSLKKIAKKIIPRVPTSKKV